MSQAQTSAAEFANMDDMNSPLKRSFSLKTHIQIFGIFENGMEVELLQNSGVDEMEALLNIDFDLAAKCEEHLIPHLLLKDNILQMKHFIMSTFNKMSRELFSLKVTDEGEP
jgi:hypothetical protein